MNIMYTTDMKTMKCNQLGGPENCNEEFTAETFEEIANLSKEHGMEMFKKGDKDHLTAMEEMKKKMSKPEDMQKWMEEKRKVFDSLS